MRSIAPCPPPSRTSERHVLSSRYSGARRGASLAFTMEIAYRLSGDWPDMHVRKLLPGSLTKELPDLLYRAPYPVTCEPCQLCHLGSWLVPAKIEVPQVRRPQIAQCTKRLSPDNCLYSSSQLPVLRKAAAIGESMREYRADGSARSKGQAPVQKLAEVSGSWHCAAAAAVVIRWG